MSFSSSRPAEKKSPNYQNTAANRSEDVLIKQSECLITSASVEDADASVSAIVDLIPSQRGVAVRLDPHARHGVVKDLIVFNEAQTCYNKQKH